VRLEVRGWRLKAKVEEKYVLRFIREVEAKGKLWVDGI
jgi:hypothetical protein